MTALQPETISAAPVRLDHRREVLDDLLGGVIIAGHDIEQDAGHLPDAERLLQHGQESRALLTGGVIR